MKRTGKILGIITAAALAFSAAVIPVSAAKSHTEGVSVVRVWNGKADTSWYTGDKNEYNISTPEQLAGVSKLCNNGTHFEGVQINLTSDICLNDTSDWSWDWVDNPPKNIWTPIGKSGNPISGYNPFCGYFNGNGHTISGMYVHTDGEAGLFGYIYYSAIENVKIGGSIVVSDSAYDHAYAGAIAGIAERSFIDKCDNLSCAVVAYGAPASNLAGWHPAYAGGIVGSMHTENMSALLGYTLILGAGYVVNPLIITDGNSAIGVSYVRDCRACNYVYAEAGTDSYAGGIAGYNDNGHIINCLGNATVESVKNLGKYSRSYSSYAGNIEGDTNNGTMKNCYYNSENNEGIGGVAKNKYYDNTVDNSVGLTFAELKKKSAAKKLGSSFYHSSGHVPRVASLDYYDVYVELNGKKMLLCWDYNTYNNVKEYVIYKKNSKGKYEKVKTVSEMKTTISGITKGKKYSFMIQAVYKNGTKKTIKNGKFTFTA